MLNTLTICAFFYGLLVFVFFRLPDLFWDENLQRLERTKNKLKHCKKNLPLTGEISRGEELLIRIQETESRIVLGQKVLPEQLLRYKFYTDLLEQLFEIYRRLGAPVRKILPELRRGITRDLQFERKIFSETTGALMQFLVIALTTWGFVFLSSYLIDIPPSKTILGFMMILEVLGVIVFFHLMKFLRKKTFAAMASALTELYLFTSLMNAGLSLNDVLKRSGLMEGTLMNSGKLETFATRTKKLIERMKVNGLSPMEEAQEILDGLWHFQDENFVKFTKKVQLLKFCILAFFFLPAYFLYLASIFQFFMEQ